MYNIQVKAQESNVHQGDTGMQREYNYPVFGTQGGGLVREVGPNHYIFVEKPDCPGLDVGDDMPEEWGIAAANNAAIRMVEDEQEKVYTGDESCSFNI